VYTMLSANCASASGVISNAIATFKGNCLMTDQDRSAGYDSGVSSTHSGKCDA
jgi:hypothetical protein